MNDEISIKMNQKFVEINMLYTYFHMDKKENGFFCFTHRELNFPFDNSDILCTLTYIVTKNIKNKQNTA